MPINRPFDDSRRPDTISPSSWRDRWLRAQTDLRDRSQVIELRQQLEKLGPHQLWYYAGAGVDRTPLLVAPQDATHWWVDVAYGQDARIRSQIDIDDLLIAPMRNLGADIQVASFSENSKLPVQQITIDHQTHIQLHPGSLEEPQNLPSHVDVVYTSTVSPSCLQSIGRLTKGGLLLVMGEKNTSPTVMIPPPLSHLRLENIGLNQVGEITFNQLASAQNGATENKHKDGCKICIYQKQKELDTNWQKALELCDLSEAVDNQVRDYCRLAFDQEWAQNTDQYFLSVTQLDITLHRLTACLDPHQIPQDMYKLFKNYLVAQFKNPNYVDRVSKDRSQPAYAQIKTNAAAIQSYVLAKLAREAGE